MKTNINANRVWPESSGSKNDKYTSKSKPILSAYMQFAEKLQDMQEDNRRDLSVPEIKRFSSCIDGINAESRASVIDCIDKIIDAVEENPDLLQSLIRPINELRGTLPKLLGDSNRHKNSQAVREKFDIAHEKMNPQLRLRASKNEEDEISASGSFLISADFDKVKNRSMTFASAVARELDSDVGRAVDEPGSAITLRIKKVKPSGKHYGPLSNYEVIDKHDERSSVDYKKLVNQINVDCEDGIDHQAGIDVDKEISELISALENKNDATSDLKNVSPAIVLETIDAINDPKLQEKVFLKLLKNPRFNGKSLLCEAAKQGRDKFIEAYIRAPGKTINASALSDAIEQARSQGKATTAEKLQSFQNLVKRLAAGAINFDGTENDFPEGADKILDFMKKVIDITRYVPTANYGNLSTGEWLGKKGGAENSFLRPVEERIEFKDFGFEERDFIKTTVNNQELKIPNLYKHKEMNGLTQKDLLDKGIAICGDLAIYMCAFKKADSTINKLFDVEMYVTDDKDPYDHAFAVYTEKQTGKKYVADPYMRWVDLLVKHPEFQGEKKISHDGRDQGMFLPFEQYEEVLDANWKGMLGVEARLKRHVGKEKIDKTDKNALRPVHPGKIHTSSTGDPFGEDKGLSNVDNPVELVEKIEALYARRPEAGSNN